MVPVATAVKRTRVSAIIPGVAVVAFGLVPSVAPVAAVAGVPSAAADVAAAAAVATGWRLAWRLSPR